MLIHECIIQTKFFCKCINIKDQLIARQIIDLKERINPNVVRWDDNVSLLMNILIFIDFQGMEIVTMKLNDNELFNNCSISLNILLKYYDENYDIKYPESHQNFNKVIFSRLEYMIKSRNEKIESTPMIISTLRNTDANIDFEDVAMGRNLSS